MKNCKTPLNEITRWEIIRRSQREASGTPDNPGRWQKKSFYRAKDFNNVDFEELFTNDTFVWKSRVGDYIVVISFEGAFSNLYNIVRSWGGTNRWKRIDLKMLTKCLSKSLDEDDLYVSCTCPDFCLHGDTLIKCLDGNSYKVKELLNKFKEGQDIWVYSTDENGDFMPGHVSDIWISGCSKKMVKVTLDNDESIVTTPNHLYMLRDGSYARADSLCIGQSLMPMYFRYYNGYENVMLNSKPKSFISVYKRVADVVLKDKIDEARIRSQEDVISIHHADFNKLNNSPNNLKPMGHQEHYRYHYTHIKENKELLEKFIRGGHEYWRTPEGRKIKSEQMRKNITSFWNSMSEEERKSYIERSHSWQRTDIGHTKLSNGLKDYWDNLQEDIKKERTRKSGIILNGEDGKKASERIKNYWSNLSEEDYKRHCEQNRMNSLSKKDTRITDKCIAARKINGKKCQEQLIYNRCCEILHELLDNNLIINEENYNKYRKKGYPYYRTAVEYGIIDTFNHKVKNIEILEYTEAVDVYDLTVDTYNNFLVDAGVILHNCYRFDYWLTQAGAKYGTPQNRPPRVRNVKNNKGYVCKHILAVLYGKRWVPAAAKAWLSYIRQNPELAEEMIWG